MINESIFDKRSSIEQVEESPSFAPKFLTKLDKIEIRIFRDTYWQPTLN